MAKKLPHIMIVDDHPLFRDGVKTLLELNQVGTVIAEASNGFEFLEQLNHLKPDIVLMDIEMPLMNGIVAVKAATEQYPQIKILVISMFTDHRYYLDMISSGAKGFIFKTANKADLTNAIKSVLRGETYFSSNLLQEMLINLKDVQSETKEPSIQFNTKEIEIISHMTEGLSAKEIADKTNLSPKTVSNYKTLMLEKTGCKNAVSLVIYAIKHKLIQI